MSIARACLALLLSAAPLIAACDPNPKSWKTPNMTALSPRLEPLFAKTKTICFGRFLIDVPETVTVSWGAADVPLGVSVYPSGVDQVKALAQAEIASLNSEKAIHHDNQPLLISNNETTQPPGTIVTGYESFDAISGLKINGYFALESYGVVINARPLKANQDRATAKIVDMARHLRPRPETEIPSEPGLCLDHAFLADKPSDPAAEFIVEHIRIGFRLKEFPDAHLSIYTAAKDRVVESDALEPRVERAGKEAHQNGFGALRDRVKFFRKGDRSIGELSGYEVLARIPPVEQVREHHDMRFVSLSAEKNALKPMFDIAFATGVKDNQTGAMPPSLTDEEAIAVWDKITSSIRVRPTGGGTKTSEATPAKTPLGELVATGRACPQPGWWECAEVARPVQGGRRQFFHGGDRMPHAVLQGEPSVWQKLKGDAPTYRVATVWKLVDYDEPATPPAAASAQQTPAPKDADTSGAAPPTEPHNGGETSA